MISGGLVRPVSIDHTTPGTTDLVQNRANAYRNAGILHRSGIAAVDKLAVPASPTVADVTTGGSLVFSTTYNMTYAAGNRWGPTTVPAVGSVSMANDAASTHVARCTLAQVAGADYYDLFLSTDAAPKWVARITETQRNSGCTVTAVGTVTGTSPGAGKVDIQVVGTGVASNAAPFNFNNAFTPASITPINCAGYTTALFQVKLAVDDLRSVPAAGLVIFVQNQLSTNDWSLSSSSGLTFLTARSPLAVQLSFAVNGAAAMVAAFDTLTGQNPVGSIWVDLC